VGDTTFPQLHRQMEVEWPSVSEQDCGAVDSFHSAVQLRKPNRATFFHPFGRSRVHPTTVFTVGHDPRLLKLEWAGPHALVIRYPNDSRSPEEFRCESQWEDVQIKRIPFVPDYSTPVAKMPPVKRWTW
jgi:hypothetical protein